MSSRKRRKLARKGRRDQHPIEKLVWTHFHCTCLHFTLCNLHSTRESALCHSLSRLVLHQLGHTLSGTIRSRSSRSAVDVLQLMAYENCNPPRTYPGQRLHRMSRMLKVSTHARLCFSRNLVTARIAPGLDQFVYRRHMAY